LICSTRGACQTTGQHRERSDAGPES
jgi:hypothetical protein